jgi:hypothetical protein
MKRLVLLLTPDLYDRLELMAAAQDRDPAQQARVIIRAALLPGLEKESSTTSSAEHPKPQDQTSAASLLTGEAHV